MRPCKEEWNEEKWMENTCKCKFYYVGQRWKPGYRNTTRKEAECGLEADSTIIARKVAIAVQTVQPPTCRCSRKKESGCAMGQ